MRTRFASGDPHERGQPFEHEIMRRHRDRVDLCRCGTVDGEAAHRTDHVGDFAEGTMRCSDSSDEWQVGTRLFEGPKRYYRVRWRPPFSFTLVGVSETPSAACTAKDEHADAYPDILSDLR